MNTQLNVAVLVYPSVEVVDMNGPIDAFVKANRLNNNHYNVYTVAATTQTLKSEKGVVTITPGYDINNCPVPDIVVIPGIIEGEPDQSLIDWIKKMGNAGKTVMSVCIGAFILAKTGLLNGKRATTHYLSLGDLHQQYPTIKIERNVRFVQDGNIVTTAGITSGIDGALHLIEKFDGAALAQQAADIMVYNREGALPPFTLVPPYAY
jgi:transcriptional regulator GlxA family with amidase domain